MCHQVLINVTELSLVYGTFAQETLRVQLREHQLYSKIKYLIITQTVSSR
jgi:hypothetical protein